MTIEILIQTHEIDKMKQVIQIIVLLLIVACNGVDSIKTELINLKSKPLIMPLHSTIIYHGEDTLINDFFQSGYKMVVYTDSTSCSGCAINKMFMWQDIIDRSEKRGANLKYYFIFSPSKNNDIRTGLKMSQLDYPMILDRNCEFERLNPHLPKNKAMHTFLLDENNNVILVGNPVTNKQIEKMFYEEVEKRLK